MCSYVRSVSGSCLTSVVMLVPSRSLSLICAVCCWLSLVSVAPYEMQPLSSDIRETMGHDPRRQSLHGDFYQQQLDSVISQYQPRSPNADVFLPHRRVQSTLKQLRILNAKRDKYEAWMWSPDYSVIPDSQMVFEEERFPSKSHAKVMRYGK